MNWNLKYLRQYSIPMKDAHTISLLRLVLFLLTAMLITVIIIGGCEFCSGPSSVKRASRPTFAVYIKSTGEEHLKHVFNVLQRFGYRRIPLDDDDAWDLLWAHDYPFKVMPHRLENLQAHQVVNHWPGDGFIVNKVDLCTAPLPFMPRAFRLPQQREEFLSYAHAHPQALFVQKHNEHRHIQIRSMNEINLSSNDSFVQEYVPNPLLVDGYKFDIGIYVVITSVDPLRVYIYTGDVLFRYCPVKYHPFDPHNVDKYVVGDDYLPTWEVPSLGKYYNKFGGSMRGVFEAYMQDQRLDSSDIWKQVEDIVRRTVLAKEQDIVRLLQTYKTRNFFDLLRFDLIVDDQMRVHLMEANMSPNLSSTHFRLNALIYEQVLYSALQLVGLGSPVRRSSLRTSTEEVEEMITAEKNLATNLNKCVANMCDKLCNMDECSLCLPCLTGTEYEILQRAHREHLHRVDMKRIFPKPILKLDEYDLEAEVKNLSKRNEWLTSWFYGKCQYEHNWCS